jgi:hypothetical protein
LEEPREPQVSLASSLLPGANILTAELILCSITKYSVKNNIKNDSLLLALLLGLMVIFLETISGAARVKP